MIYEIPKSRRTIYSMPIGRVMQSYGGIGADRFPSGAVYQPASRQREQSDGGIPPRDGFNDAGMERLAGQE